MTLLGTMSSLHRNLGATENNFLTRSVSEDDSPLLKLRVSSFSNLS